MLEELAVFTLLDCLNLRADEFDVVLLENAQLVESHCCVQGSLPTESRQNCVWSLLGDDRFDNLRSNRFDVGGICEVWVGHDCCRVRVNQDDSNTLFLKHAASLGARVVKLAGLTDDDRARADDQNTLYIATLWHYLTFLFALIRSTSRSKR